jgi:co-chaperonin GroES (HSP10)
MIEPLGQRIVVKRLAEKERNGIYIPEQARKTSLVGEVLATGPDADWVSKGDIVHFARFSGVDVKADGKYVGDEYEDCLYMNCEDLLGVIKTGQAPAEIKEATAL